MAKKNRHTFHAEFLVNNVVMGVFKMHVKTYKKLFKKMVDAHAEEKSNCEYALRVESRGYKVLLEKCKI